LLVLELDTLQETRLAYSPSLLQQAATKVDADFPYPGTFLFKRLSARDIFDNMEKFTGKQSCEGEKRQSNPTS